MNINFDRKLTQCLTSQQVANSHYITYSQTIIPRHVIEGSVHNLLIIIEDTCSVYQGRLNLNSSRVALDKNCARAFELCQARLEGLNHPQILIIVIFVLLNYNQLGALKTWNHLFIIIEFSYVWLTFELFMHEQYNMFIIIAFFFPPMRLLLNNKNPDRRHPVRKY